MRSLSTLRFRILLLLPVLFLLSSCLQKQKDEQQELSYWGHSVLDSSYAQLYRTKQLEPALHSFDSLSAGISYASPQTKASRYALIANYHYFFGKDHRVTATVVDSALHFLSDAAIQATYPRSSVGLLLFGGHLAYQLQEYSKANTYYFRAKRIADAYLSPCDQAAYNYNIAMVLFSQQNFAMSDSFFQRAYQLQSGCAPQTTRIILQQQEILSNIGLCRLKMKQYENARLHFSQALQLAEQFRDSLGPVVMEKINGVVSGHLGEVCFLEGRLQEAAALARKSIALNLRPGYEMAHAVSVQVKLAAIYGQLHQQDSMRVVLQQARGALDSLPNPNVEADWNKLMALYHETRSEDKQALPFYKRYAFLRDSLDELQSQLMVADVGRKMYELDRELQIDSLSRTNKLTSRSLLIAIPFSVMAFVILILIGTNYRKSRKSLATVLALNEEISRQKAAREKEAKLRHRQITKAVILAQERERSFIGLELHDNVNQILTTAKLHIELVNSGVGDVTTMLSRSTRYIQDSINEIRNLSKRLSAPTLGRISLKESITDLLDSVRGTDSFRIHQQIEGLDNILLRQELQLGIYRIVQEQLNNISKHADASDVWVNLQLRQQQLSLVITDNGKGFQTEQRFTGIGLTNMRTRAEYLDGLLKIVSAPGKGCRVEVLIPCPVESQMEEQEC